MRDSTLRFARAAALLLPAGLALGCAARSGGRSDSLPDPCGAEYTACRNGCPLEDSQCESRCFRQAEACESAVASARRPPRRCANEHETCVFNCETTFVDVTREREKCIEACDDGLEECLARKK